MNFDKIYISIVIYLVRTTSHKLKIKYYNIAVTYGTFFERQYVAISMISGGSRSFAEGKGQIIFSIMKILKMGMEK